MSLPESLAKLFDKLLDWSYHSPRFAIILLLVSGAFFILDESLLNKFALLEFRNQYKSVLGLVLLLSVGFLVSYPVAGIYLASSRWVSGKYTRYTTKKRLINWLEYLTPKQKEALRNYIDERERVTAFDMDDGAVRELVRVGILGKTTGYVNYFNLMNFTIDPWVFSYLKEHPELIAPE